MASAAVCQGGRAFQDDCVLWGQQDPNNQNSINLSLSDYCGNNMSNFTIAGNCREWCAQEGRGLCDNVAFDYCNFDQCDNPESEDCIANDLICSSNSS